MSIATKLGAATLAFAAAVGTSGCATTGNYGLPTMAGAAVGGAAGAAISSSPLAIIGGAVAGGVVGNMFEPDCQTSYNSTVRRGVSGNATSQWQGNESMRTRCNYSGNNAPANLNAPSHLQHMQQGPRPTPWK